MVVVNVAGASASAAAAQATFAAAAGAVSGLLCLAALAVLILALRRRRRKGRSVKVDPPPLPPTLAEGKAAAHASAGPAAAAPEEPARWTFAVQVPPASEAAVAKYSPPPSPRRPADDSRGPAEPEDVGRGGAAWEAAVPAPPRGLPRLRLSTVGSGKDGGVTAVAAAEDDSATGEVALGSSVGGAGTQRSAYRVDLRGLTTARTSGPPSPLLPAPSHPFSPLRLVQEEASGTAAAVAEPRGAAAAAAVVHDSEWGRALDWLLGDDEEAAAEGAGAGAVVDTAALPLASSERRKKLRRGRSKGKRARSPPPVVEGGGGTAPVNSAPVSLDPFPVSLNTPSGGGSGSSGTYEAPPPQQQQPAAGSAEGEEPYEATAAAAAPTVTPRTDPSAAVGPSAEDAELELLADVFFSPAAAASSPARASERPAAGGGRGAPGGFVGSPAAAWAAPASSTPPTSTAAKRAPEAWGAAALRRAQSLFDDGDAAVAPLSPGSPYRRIASPGPLSPYRPPGLPLSPQARAPQLAVFRSASSRSLAPHAGSPSLHRGGGSLRSLVPAPSLLRIDAGGAAGLPVGRAADYSAAFISELLEEDLDEPPAPPLHRPQQHRRQAAPPWATPIDEDIDGVN